MPFPGFSEAFHADRPIDPPRAIVDIDERELANVLRIANRHEAIKTAVNMFVTRLVADKNRQEDPPSRTGKASFFAAHWGPGSNLT